MTNQRTPLYDLILKNSPRMTDFAGWEMPIQFIGITPEHQAVRNNAGIFDISHMGMLEVKGENILQNLQAIVPTDLSKLLPGTASYTVLLNTDGGIIDDIIIYYQTPNCALIIVNAATKAQDLAWLHQQLDSASITLHDRSPDNVLLALQGPQAINYLQPLVKNDLSQLKAFHHQNTLIDGETAFIARTGYTGEDGFEIMVSANVGRKIWQNLLDQGVTPCGLGCRDTLRLEAAMCLYGQDIDQNTTPLMAGLGWLVNLDHNFIGKETLLKQKNQGIDCKLVALEMNGRHIARHDYPIFIDDRQVGTITSGTLSPTLQKAIALGYIVSEYAKIGNTVMVEIRGKKYPATIVKKPFYRSSQPAPK